MAEPFCCCLQGRSSYSTVHMRMHTFVHARPHARVPTHIHTHTHILLSRVHTVWRAQPPQQLHGMRPGSVARTHLDAQCTAYMIRCA